MSGSLLLADRIHVAIRSYNRAGQVRTLSVVPFAWVWVPESQGEAYRAHYGDRVITIPDELDGNPARKCNAILDRAPSDWVLLLDDDISAIGYWEAGQVIEMRPNELEDMIIHHFYLAADLGVTLWGINTTNDGRVYDTYRPFNLLAPILGPFHGHLPSVVRYDETVWTKDDYDFWLQTILVYRMTLRANKYFYVTDHGTLKGGIVSIRTRELEEAGIRRMKEKWGGVFRVGGQAGAGASGKNILNSKVIVPIPGC